MKKEKFINALGSRVRKIRSDNEMSLYRLAKNSGKTDVSISRLENGKVNPSLFYLYEIAEGLGITLEELVKGLP